MGLLIAVYLLCIVAAGWFAYDRARSLVGELGAVDGLLLVGFVVAGVGAWIAAAITSNLPFSWML